MSVPINLRIKIAPLMAKLESSVVIRRKLQAEFGKYTSTEACIKRSFDRFCATAKVEDREHRGRPSKITAQKFNEVRDVTQDEPQSSVRAVSTACSILAITAYRIMSESLGLKPFKMQFIQRLYEADLQDRVDMCKTLISRLQNKSTQENTFFLTELPFIYMD